MKLFLTLFCSFLSLSIFAQKPGTKSAVTITTERDPGHSSDSVLVSVRAYDAVNIPTTKNIVKKMTAGVAVWVIPTNVPIRVYITFLPTTFRTYFLAEPGDNITFNLKNGKLGYRGKGIEKIKIKERLDQVRDSLDFMITNKIRYDTKSLADYLEWNQYLNTRIRVSLPLIDSYKNKLSQIAYAEIRNSTLDRIADDRSDKFASFLGFAAKNGFSAGQISQIYDSTYAANTKEADLPALSGKYFGSWAFVKFKVMKEFGFETSKFPLNSEKDRNLMFYKTACSIYSGFALEKFKVDFITDKLIHDLGFIPETDSVLNTYYSEPGYPEYKAFVREYEFKARGLKAGQTSPKFSLITSQAKRLQKEDLKGKVILIDFWFTGCVGCVQMTPALKKVEEHFKEDTSVVFLSVSIDKNKAQWLKSIKEGKYTTGTALNLYTEGKGDSHPMIKDFQVRGYPSLYLIDAHGKVVANPVPDPRGGKESELISLIEKQLVLLKDGPYLFEDGKEITAYQVEGNQVEKSQSVNRNITFKVATDQYQRSFDVRLQSNLQIVPSEFPATERLIAFSDIEGNFDALRKLLQSNGVINDAMDWTFGNGHLVFAGDLFDRGQQVTECLWLIYSLEEKAKIAGGYVHFVLGNHELMNLSGNANYVKEKYIDNAKLLGISYKDLYYENSELGRWLRTKNVIEKVGKLIFTHGGISPEFLKLGLTLGDVNKLARPFFATDSLARKSTDKNLATIFSTKKGPFWYREYFLDAPIKIYSGGDTLYRTSQVTVDNTLAFYGVKHIVTGHTIVKPGEHVSVHYNNKVINTDTEHAKGKSEALLVEGNSYYRVNDKGQRWLLFKDEEKVSSGKSNE